MRINTLLQQKFIAALIMIFCVTGCSRGIKEGLYAVKGSSGKIVIIQGDKEQLSQLALRYGSVRIGRFTNDLGPVCPQEFLDQLPVAIPERLKYRSRSISQHIKFKKKEDAGPFFTGPADKILLIEGRVIQYDAVHFDAQGVLQKAVGPLDEAICRVRVLDQKTGELISEANCIGRAKSSVRTGPTELAKGIARAIRKLLKPRKDDD